MKLASYSLSDFILFSATSYYRQFELYNLAIWPLHLLAMVFICFTLYALLKRPNWAGRAVAGILVISWLWVSWAFLYQRFYQIHVIANWYAWAFVLQASLIFWFGLIKNRFNTEYAKTINTRIAAVLLPLAFVVYPLIPFVSGRSWRQLELFALAPDPTVLATFALLLLCRAPVVLYVIPVLWAVISGITLSVM